MLNRFLPFFCLCIPTIGLAADSCPLRKEIGQLLIAEITPPIEDFKAYARQSNLGGVILFADTLSELKDPNDIVNFTNQLQAGMPTGMFVSIDQEGGLVQRLNRSKGFTMLPPAKYLGEAAATNPNLPTEFGQVLASELAAVGVNFNFAPVADIATNAQNPVVATLKRAYGEQPKKVGEIASDVIEGMQSQGVIATAKHFPGHGDTQGDSHSGEVSINKSWKEILSTEAVPFIMAINRGVGAIMAGHIKLPNVQSCGSEPASLSHFLLTDILRKTWGFKGLIITDDLSMGAIALSYSIEEATEKAILAGNDLLIVRHGSEKQIIESLCKISSDSSTRGKALAERIHDSYLRIMDSKRQYHIDPPRHLPPVDLIPWKEHQQVVTEILNLSPSGAAVKDKYLTTGSDSDSSPVPANASQGLRTLLGK